MRQKKKVIIYVLFHCYFVIQKDWIIVFKSYILKFSVSTESSSEKHWLLCSFYRDFLRAQIIRNVNSFISWANTGFKSKIGTWWSHLELPFE